MIDFEEYQLPTEEGTRSEVFDLAIERMNSLEKFRKLDLRIHNEKMILIYLKAKVKTQKKIIRKLYKNELE